MSKLCVADKIGYGAFAGSSDPASLVRQLSSRGRDIELQKAVLPVGAGVFLLVDDKIYLVRINKECIGWLYYEQ